jgi:phage terminase large subunit-like protein
VHLFPWPEGGEGHFMILPRFWIPKDNIQDREHRDAAQYEKWVRQGYLTATDGNVIDYKVVRAAIERDMTVFRMQKLAYDPWGPAEAIRQQLLESGMPEDFMIQFRQGFASMSPAMKTLERLYLEHKIHGLNHPVMLWMASNMQAKVDPAENVKPDKGGDPKGRHKSTRRIDGFVCLVMCVGLWMATGSDTGRSVYEERGPLVFG